MSNYYQRNGLYPENVYDPANTSNDHMAPEDDGGDEEPFDDAAPVAEPASLRPAPVHLHSDPGVVDNVDMVDDYATANVQRPLGGRGMHSGGGGGDPSSMHFLPSEESKMSFDALGSPDPALLFQILEEALPKHTEAGRAPTAGELQQKRDQVEHTWERVRRWMWAHPSLEERQAAAFIRGQADATPLHLVCKLHNPPEDVVQALAEAAADTASWTDTHGWLPLHHACANGAPPEVIRILIDTYPPAKLAQDNQRRTPLHFYATRPMDNPALMAVNAELLSDTGAAALVDLGGMLPLHYACAYGTHPAVLEVLAKVYPASLTAIEQNGRTPMHLAMVNAHRDASPAVIDFLLQTVPGKQTINYRDQDGYLPLHLLALGLKGYRADDPEKRQNVSECLQLYLQAEPVAVADFLTSIQDLPDWLQDTAVVSKHVRNVLNERIVRRFPTSILMLDGIMLVVLIVSFAITTRNHIDTRFDESLQNETDETFGALVILFCGSAYFLLRELIQIASLMSLGSLKSWWSDSTNWLDMSVIFLTFYYGILMLDDSWELISHTAFRSGVAFTQGVLWVAIIVFLKSTLVDFAVFVGGVFYVVQRLVAFLIAVGVILLAFAQMFYFVYVDTDICDDPANTTAWYDEELDCRFAHCTFEESLLKVYTMMMGEIGDETRYSTNLAAQVLYVGYGFLVVILLSNVLIAIVTDSYEIIQNDRAAIVFWSNRLDFVAEMDAIAYALQRRLGWHKGGKGGGKHLGDADPNFEAQEAANMNQGSNPTSSHHHHHHHDTAHGGGGLTGTNGNHPDEERTPYFREAWSQVMMLFDANLYDEIDLFETWVYNFFRIFCIFIVIPLWLALGAVTAGWLWPPQVREYLFVQKETAISRAELERLKLAQLKGIQTDLKTFKSEMLREIASDREELLRMKTDMETIQSEVLTDLMQVKELMSSLVAN